MTLERPLSIHSDDALVPKGPWSFLRAGLSGSFSREGLGLMGGWVMLALVPAFFWARSMVSNTAFAGGYSGLPAHWGEQLDAKDIVELFKNGEVHSPVGFMASSFLIVGLLLVFACGWRMQARSAGLQGGLRAWVLGLFDTALVGLVPIGLVYGLAYTGLWAISDHGLAVLSWTAFILKPLALASFASALSVQWWLLRLGREGASEEFGTQLGHGFLRLWAHPVEWFALVVGGAAVRLTLQALVLWTAWRMGGSTVGRVWAFAGLELLAAAINGWLLGWLLRATALYWLHDLELRRAIKALKALVKAPLPVAEDLPLEVQG
ncbi:MAG TPA: hypothetical protein VJ483_00085 [Holophagaceae bacterium]|nr:hypothetical protein [Holophagaceae bacterium]